MGSWGSIGDYEHFTNITIITDANPTIPSQKSPLLPSFPLFAIIKKRETRNNRPPNIISSNGDREELLESPKSLHLPWSSGAAIKW